MKKIKNRRGFTLAEVLIAIAVIAIICAIAIPAIVRANNSLTKQQANDYAMSIYLAVQDELASKRTDGSIENLQGSYPTVYVDKEAKTPDIVNDPVDVKGMLEGVTNDETNLAAKLKELDKERQYVYLNTDSRPDMTAVLPIDSIDESIFDNNPTVTVVFNEVTGDVLYVRYAVNKVYGEYDGGIVSVSADNLAEIQPMVGFVNGQTCYVRVNVVPPEDQDMASFVSKLTYKFTITGTGAESNKSFTEEFTGDTLVENGFEINSVTGQVKYILDSLVNGKSFEDKAKSFNPVDYITPGSDVQVTVVCTYKDPGNGKATELKHSDPVTGNPLFSKVENKTVYLSNGRNLQNLDRLAGSVAKDITGIKVSDNVGNIYWSETADHYYGKIDEVDGETILRFAPLTLDKYTKAVTFDGTPHVQGSTAKNVEISDLYVHVSGDAGLFGTLKNTVTVQNITLSDPCVQSTGGNAGAIAGTNKGTVKDCKVNCNTVSDASVALSGPKNVGLLVGSAESGTISGCEVKVDETQACGENFGLLVGYSKSNISSSKASGAIDGGSANVVGGAIGCTNGGTYSNINADVDIKNIRSIWGTSHKHGDFTPSSFGAAACPSGVGYAGKFVGYIDNGKFDTCTASGKDDKNLQFIGVVRAKNVSTSGDKVYSSTKNVSGTFTVEQSVEDASKYYNSQNYEFKHAKTYITYDNTINLNKCKFLYNADNKNYYQTLTTDMYYYDMDKTVHEEKYNFTDYTNDYSTDLDGKQYLITDSTGKYALCVKVVKNDSTASNYYVPPVLVGQCLRSGSDYQTIGLFDNDVEFMGYNSDAKVYDYDNNADTFKKGYPEMRAYLQSIGKDCDDDWYFYIYDYDKKMPNHNKNNHKLYLTQDHATYGSVTFEDVIYYNGSGFSSDYPYPRSEIANGSFTSWGGGNTSYYNERDIYGYQHYTSYEICSIPIDMKNGTLKNDDFKKLNALWENDEWSRVQSNSEAIIVKNSTARASWVKDVGVFKRDDKTYNEPVCLSLEYGLFASRGFDEITDGRHARVIPAIRYVADVTTKIRSLYVTKETDSNGSTYLTVARDKAGSDAYLTINSQGIVGASSSVSSTEKLKVFIYDPVDLKYDVVTLTNNGAIERVLGKTPV